MHKYTTYKRLLHLKNTRPCRKGNGSKLFVRLIEQSIDNACNMWFGASKKITRDNTKMTRKELRPKA